MIATTIKIDCWHLYIRIAQVFRIGRLPLHWITPGCQKSTNESTRGFFDSKEAAEHRGILDKSEAGLLRGRIWRPQQRSSSRRRGAQGCSLQHPLDHL